jgi:hypothetical protein
VTERCGAKPVMSDNNIFPLKKRLELKIDLVYFLSTLAWPSTMDVLVICRMLPTILELKGF